MEDYQIIETNMENIFDLGICGYKDIKRPGFLEKVEWMRERFSEGMIIKTLYTETGGTQGMIEYIPGEYCWRPVEAYGYMFIHCLFVGFKKLYKGRGFATVLLKECIQDAKKENMHGVVVVTRKSSFMVGKELFLKNGFTVVDSAPSDFELLAKQFNDKATLPKFKGDLKERLSPYQEGLTIIRANQCPYTVKNVREICQVSERDFFIKPRVVDLKNYKEAQKSPCPFGTFCIVYNGQVIAEHPISKTRFTNIMRKIEC
jgi:GNAT superfamily N-acetyltransferase